MLYDNFFRFLLEFNLSLALGFGLFYWILRKQNLHQWNRIFLILWPMVCIVIASLHFDYTVTVAMNAPVVTDLYDNEIMEEWLSDPTSANKSLFESSTGLSLMNSAHSTATYLSWRHLYLAGVLFTFLLFAFRLKALWRLIQIGFPKTREGFTLLEHPNYDQTFSFGKYIFKQKDREIPDMILAHELVHVQQNHSLDLLWLEVLIILNWFNPFIYRYRKYLKETHEFIADQVVVQQYGLLDYARLLVSQASCQPVPILALSFAAFTKKRILAMKTNTTNRWSRIRYWVVLPLFLMLVSVFAVKRVEKVDFSFNTADAAVKWGDLNCHCWASNLEGFYNCDLKEIDSKKMSQLIQVQPTIELNTNRHFEEVKVNEYSVQVKSSNPQKDGSSVYFNSSFFEEEHDLWKHINIGDKLLFKAHLDNGKVIEFGIGIYGIHPEKVHSQYLQFPDQKMLPIDPIDHHAKFDFDLTNLRNRFQKGFYINQNGNPFNGPVSISLNRQFSQGNISYSISDISFSPNGKIDLKDNQLLNTLLPGETLTLFLSTGNNIKAGENYTIEFNISGANPLVAKELGINWDGNSFSGNKITLSADQITQYKKKSPELTSNGNLLQKANAPMYYTNFKPGGKSYFQKAEINRFNEVVKTKINLLDIILSNRENFNQKIRDEYILVPTKEGYYFPLSINLKETNSSYSSNSENEDLFQLDSNLYTWAIEESKLEKISSGFGYRMHPVLKERRFHSGIDLIAPLGTPILAIADGEVIEVEEESYGYGKKIVIQHANEIETLYAQLQSIQVKVGEHIKKGEQIGTLGSSGLSTGPHLHFEIKEKGKPKDPSKILPELN